MRRRAALAALLTACLLAGPALPPNAVASSEPWGDPTRAHRVVVAIGAAGVDRTDRVVPVPFAPAGLDPASIHVMEVDGSGAVVDPLVPHQLDGGDLLVLLEGSTPAPATRRYHLYYDTPSAAVTPVAVPDLVAVSDSTDAGQDAWAVATPGHAWWYQKEGSAFSSLVDDDGNDWIGYSTAPGSAGAYRGVPNSPHPEGHFHPGSTSASSTLLADGPLRAVIRSVSDDGKWAYETAVEPAGVRSRVTRVPSGTAYWWLYEGTPGGEIDAGDVVHRPGADIPITGSFTADIGGVPEWAGFEDTGDGRTLWIAHHEGDSAVDSYRLMENQMTVFGFGRQGTTKYLTGLRTFSMGLTRGSAAASAADAATPPSVVAGGIEHRDGGGGPTVVVDDFSGTALDPAWSVTAPVAGSSVAVGGGVATLKVPAGASTNPWTPTNRSLRITRPAPTGDVAVEAKFKGVPSKAKQMEGIVAELSATRFLRADVMSTSTTARKIFVGTVDGSTAVVHANVTVSPGTGPVYLRVTRTGTTWSVAWSSNGTSWSSVKTLTWAGSPSRIGVFAGSHNSTTSNIKAFSALVDRVTITTP